MESLKRTNSINGDPIFAFSSIKALNVAIQKYNRQQINNKMTTTCSSKLREHFILTNGFHTNQTSSVAKRNGYSRDYSSSRHSPSSTQSSPVQYTSSSSSSSSTQSSPIRNSSRTPSPILDVSPPSLFSHTSYHVPPPVHTGAKTAATVKLNSKPNDLAANLASKRDPVTNKIVIKTMNLQIKDKDSSVPGRSKSVIAEVPTSSPLSTTVTAPAESAKCKSGPEDARTVSPTPIPFSLPPLSLRSTENHNQENLPDLLKPRNLARYVQASAPKKTRPPEKSSRSISVLLDHDYSLLVEDKPSEKKSKRTFIIPKKTSITGAYIGTIENEDMQDNLEVVDMECSDTETDHPIELDRTLPESVDNPTGMKVSSPEVSETSEDVAMLLYGLDEYRNECKLIDEEAEIRYANGCYSRKSLNAQEGSSCCLLSPLDPPSANGDPWWEEIEKVVNSVHPNCKSSVVSQVLGEDSDDELLMMLSNSAAAVESFEREEAESDGVDLAGVDLQDSEFSSAPIFVDDVDSLICPETFPLNEIDVKEEIVESSSPVPEAIVPTEEPTVSCYSNETVPQIEPVVAEETVWATQYVSLLNTGRTQLMLETSDTESTFPEESKENMLDKVPAYILTSGRYGMKKNVLQRLNVSQDSAAIPGAYNNCSWGENSLIKAFSNDRERSRRSPSYESDSPSTCGSRSPSPDSTRSVCSSLPHRDGYRRMSDRYRPRHHRRWSRSRSRSRSRSPIYSYHQKSTKSRKRRNESEEEEQRRVVYVGKLPNNFSDRQLRDLFRNHGEIEKVSLYFRSGKDNYGFVTFKDKGDATRCLETTNKIPNFPYEVCYGGRRDFCREEYADLDGITERLEESGRVHFKKNEETSFEQLLKQYSKARRH